MGSLIFTSAIDEASGQLHALTILLPGKQSSYSLDKGLVGPKSQSGWREKTKMSCLAKNRSPGIQAIGCRYTDWAILDLPWKEKTWQMHNLVFDAQGTTITFVLVICTSYYMKIHPWTMLCNRNAEKCTWGFTLWQACGTGDTILWTSFSLFFYLTASHGSWAV